ncbi:MAG: NAD(P)/FAD-dependent oxidoreductase [Anaerolineae bacterium]
METYDVVAVGGGIAGSIAARLAAEHGLRTLLIERAKTPRNKSCSGIQFSYFEKLVGKPIPKSVLCSNTLSKMYVVTPDDTTYGSKMQVLNFWRSTFDRWLNTLAEQAGAVFQDETRMTTFKPIIGGYRLHLQAGTEYRTVNTRYLIAADGMSSRIRRSLQPDDFIPKALGGTMNYYCQGESDLDPNGLYMVNIKEYAPMMFAWIYKKDDLWVIGTGTGSGNEPIKEYIERFYAYVCRKYKFTGKIMRKEGFANPLKSSVYLGEDNILICGDAAGLLDAYRGLAMDNAALSGRFAVQAILEAEKKGTLAITPYTKKMMPMQRLIELNEEKRKIKYASSETLAASMAPLTVLRMGIKMMAADFLNKFVPAEMVITLPL